MEKILMGLVTQPAQTNDRHVTTETTNLLFPEEGADFGGDLIARNIQRGRDHGLPSYVAFYDFYFGQPKNKNEDMDCWDHKPITISQTNWDLLSTIYAHPHHIDLFVGGLAEDAVSGGLTGAVFNAIKAKQFKNLMDGDRFFFTHEDQIGSFTRDAQRHIMDRQLSDILCENTNLEKVSSNVFQVHDRENNRYKTCSTSTTDLDITKINLLK
jgi:peroxidase